MESSLDAPQIRDLDDAAIVASLDANRRAVVGKLDGLDREQATRHVLPSGVTLLGVVQHLTWVEREWFENVFLGTATKDWESDESFAVGPDATVETLVSDYRAACRRSAAIVAAAGSLDALAVAPHWYFGTVTLRFILGHMTRETARHAGHLDILRELTDGVIGDDAAPPQL
jgi:uncharacterized damage-inducible protein DinB